MAKRKAVKKSEVVETNYDCPICEDRKVVERNGKMQKCVCVIKKEVEHYLSDFPANVKVNKNMDITHIERNILYYDGVSINAFHQRAKSFMFKQFFKTGGLYYLIEGTAITDSYVVGDDLYNDFYLADFLFLKIGLDNYNSSQLTTFMNIISLRFQYGRMTWIYVYPNVPRSRLVDLYGPEFISFIFDDNNFKKVRK